MPTASMNDRSVPIIGQQLEVEGYTVAVSARCKCETGGSLVPLVIAVSSGGTVAPPSVCPRCKLGYGIEGMQMDAQGRLSFSVAVLSHKPIDS